MHRRKLLWLIAGRASIVTVLFGSAILVQLKSPGAFPIDPFFFLIGVTYALTGAYALVLKYTERHRWLLDVQFATDVGLVSAVVALTGGITSYFPSLYAVPIIAASVFESRRGGIMTGVLSSVLYTGIVMAQYWPAAAGPLPFGAGGLLPPARVALYTVGLNVFGFLAVAALSGYLAEGLRRADERLEHASNQIEDLQAFSRHIIDSLRSGVATADTGGTILTFNQAAEEITGIRAAKAIGARATDVMQLPGEFDALFAAGRRGAGTPPRVDFVFVRGDGRSIDLGVSSTPLRTPRGEIGFVLTFQDVTEARRLDREARLQQRLAAVGEMAAGIAHEIRNPLASMSGSMQILRQDLPLTAEQSQLMDIVLRESERLNETIRSLLAYAKPRQQTIRRIDVRTVVTDTARLLQNTADLAGGHEIAVGVPDSETWYDADENQLRQVIWNLATNGLRAMPRGGRLRLSITTQPAEGVRPGAVLLAVQDEGVGIAPEEIEGIFRPFRGDFSRGTGLGLSIVHRIVSDYGGDVQVASQPGAGTTVTVRLPVHTTEAVGGLV